MVLASALSLPAAAQRTTMSGGLVPSGDVASFQISPDGQYAVFLADKDTDNKFELYSVRLSTGSIVPISGAVVSGGNVFDYQISPDSARVVFRGDLVTDAVTELFSAPIAAANSRVTLSGTVVSGGTVSSGFKISPDSARVVFLGDLVADEVFELFRVQIGGKALALDFDGDDRVQALSDALMLARYQLGIRGAALTANALGVNATISSPVTIEAKIKAALEQTVP